VIPATPSAGSALQTKGRYGFTYGTMSAWIKMPSPPGYWPAFWALNGEQTGSEVFTGEIDVSELYTPRRGTHANAHVWDGPHEVWETPDLERKTGVDLSRGFHKYGVKIEPGRLTFSVDDVRVRVVKKSSSAPWAWGPDITRPNFLILDLAIRRGAGPVPSKPASMLVDRVQVVPSASG
jgi:beta-glucanase (GH16 family)